MTKFVGNSITFPKLSSAPSSPVSGDAYYDTTLNKLFSYNGTSWVDLAASGSGNTIYYQDTAPTGTLNTGDMWVDSNDDTPVTANGVPTSAFTANGTLLVGSGSSTYGSLAIGSSGKILASDGSTAKWMSNPFYALHRASAPWQATGSVWASRYWGTLLRKVNGFYVQALVNSSSTQPYTHKILYSSSLTATPSEATIISSTSNYLRPSAGEVVYLSGASTYIWAGTTTGGAAVVYTSSSLAGTWTNVTNSMTGFDNADGTMKLAANSSVAVICGTTSAVGGLWTSANGTTWTSRTWPFSTETVHVIYSVNNVFFAFTQVSSTNYLYYSTDGISWTRSTITLGTFTTDPNQYVTDFTYLSGLYIFTTYAGASDTSLMRIFTATSPAGSWTENTNIPRNGFSSSLTAIISMAYVSSENLLYVVVTDPITPVGSTGDNTFAALKIWVSSDLGSTWNTVHGDWHEFYSTKRTLGNLVSDGSNLYSFSLAYVGTSGNEYYTGDFVLIKPVAPWS